MKVVIFRHATRSPSSLGDPSLNEEGKKQAQLIASSVFPSGSLPLPTQIISSPKRRAMETFLPLSYSAHLPLTVNQGLDERGHHESLKTFTLRIKHFLSQLETLDQSSLPSSPPSCIYVCSHLDWIEEFLMLIPSDLSDTELSSPWSPATFKSFKIVDSIWSLIDSGVIEPYGD